MFTEFIGKKISKSMMNKIIGVLNKQQSWGNKIGFFEFAMIDDEYCLENDRRLIEDRNKSNEKYDVRSVRQGSITTSCETNMIPDLKGNECCDIYVFGRDNGELGDLIDNICIRLKNHCIVEIHQTFMPASWCEG